MNAEELQPLRDAIEQSLEHFSAGVAGCPERLSQAIQYSTLAPGKRLRPLLALVACQAVSGVWRPALPAACAVEMIHVYSLIHDDLPAMDDDDLRRGMPTCHKQFDEATAILAGDSLQMRAIELLATELPPDTALGCCRLLSRAAGRAFLVGGQADDLAAEGRFGPLDFQDEEGALAHLKHIHRRKTGALIVASLQLGATVGGASDEQLERLGLYGEAIGLAFQIIDDCLDVESTAEQLGKMTRKDSKLGKLTYPGLLGLEASYIMAAELIDEAIAAIENLHQSTGDHSEVSVNKVGVATSQRANSNATEHNNSEYDAMQDALDTLRSLARFVISRKK
ncbi:MAG TPA: farnesyl-diphosphate synthase [Planctomycetaceae bacterium]|nr:farnesyl-diphosphate synthase [Planctomycetaceae bacterium]